MKAVRLQAYGDVDQFRPEEAPDPAAGPGEVLVRLAVSGLNPVDGLVRQGLFAQMAPMAMPAILGCDGAGTVTAVGPDVTGFAPGERVIVHVGLTGRGTHAELAAVPVAGVARLPDGLGFEAGATLPLAGLTGWQLVQALGEVGAGDRVLVSGALGAVGRAAVRRLKEIGAVPVAGVRGERLDEGRALAGEAIAVDASPGAAAFDFLISTARPADGAALALVRDGGRVASAVGSDGGERVRVTNIFAQDDAAMLQQVADAAGRGELAIPVAQSFPLARLADAHRALEAGAHGKVLLLH